MADTIISAQDISKEFRVGSQKVRALNDCSIDVEQGERIAITGKSGAGKSTLLHCLSGLDLPSSGTVEVMGENITKMSASQRADFRLRHIGYIFQSYNLIPELTVYDNIRLPILLRHETVKEKEFKAIVETLGLSKRLTHYPAELSGGQQQRAAIARALISKPDILLCDEPTGNLDTATGRDVMNLLHSVAESCDMTLLVVTHDTELANSMQRAIRISDGEIE